MSLALLLPGFRNQTREIGLSKTEFPGAGVAVSHQSLPAPVFKVTFQSFADQFAGCAIIFLRSCLDCWQQG